jgi:hypothetical protein
LWPGVLPAALDMTIWLSMSPNSLTPTDVRSRAFPFQKGKPAL